MTSLLLFCTSPFIMAEDQMFCPTPPSTVYELPLLVTYYDPALGGVNCQEPCNIFADGTALQPEHYGEVAACPTDFLGGMLIIDGLGDVRCKDTGPAIQVTYNSYHESYVVHVDLLLEEPLACNYCLYYNWNLEW